MRREYPETFAIAVEPRAAARGPAVHSRETTPVHAHRVRRLLGLGLVLASVSPCACAMRAMPPPTQTSALQAARPPALPLLQRSLFERFPGGQLSEHDLQRVLASAPELSLPARVGVLPILPARDSRGPAPDYHTLPPGVRPLVDTLRRGDTFTIVTEMMPIPSGALGMEALREIAARYRLRYVLLYREATRSRSSLNGAAWGYGTLIGALFMSGHTLRVDAQLEASLFDVKTGLILFTTRRPARAQMYSTPFGHAEKFEALAASAAEKEAPHLAEEVRVEALRFAQAAKREAKEMQASVEE